MISVEEAHILIRSSVHRYKEAGRAFDKKLLRFNEMAEWLSCHGAAFLDELVCSCIRGDACYIPGKPVYSDVSYDDNWMASS